MKRSSRRTLLVAAAAVLLVGLASAAVYVFRQHPPPSMPPVSDTTEAVALTASKGLAWRDGDALNLRMKSGDTLMLTDRVSCGDVSCPPTLTVRYRYLGWSEKGGGYRLRLAPSTAEEMLLPYNDDSPTLLDAHQPPPGPPLAQPAAPAPSAAPNETLAEWLADVAEGRSQNEAPLIAQTNGKVARDGTKLALTLQDGHKFALTDDLACGGVTCPPQVFRAFDFSGASPDGRYWLVTQRWDEAEAALLVDSRSGTATPLLSGPKFSPDGSRVAAAVSDLEWAPPHRLEVWSLGGTAPTLEFSLSAAQADDTVYEIVGWPDATHLRLRRGSWSSEQRTEAMLVYDAGTWHLQGD
jgi:hypothetical protein